MKKELLNENSLRLISLIQKIDDHKLIADLAVREVKTVLDKNDRGNFLSDDDLENLYEKTEILINELRKSNEAKHHLILGIIQ
jgi:hypothetical protein